MEFMSPEMSRRLATIVNALSLDRAMKVRADLEQLARDGKFLASMDDLPEPMRSALLEVEATIAAKAAGTDV